MSAPSDDRLVVFADLDFTELESPPSWAAGVWRLSRRMPAWLQTTLVATAMGAGATIVILLIVTGSADSTARQIFFLVCLAVSTAVLVAVILGFRAWNRRYGRRLVSIGPELPAFAATNGFDFRQGSSRETELPMPAGFEGDIQRVSLRLTPAADSTWPRFVLGYRVFHDPVVPADFTPTAENPHPAPHDDELFVAVPLPRRLPHIALLRRAELSESNLDQRAAYSMGLEFDRAFTLLCPPGYERDALYLFTPDVMAAMIDDAAGAQWGAEVLDDWLFFRFPPSSQPNAVFAEDLRRAFLLVERTAAELEKQARNYRDERVGDRELNQVGGLGRRVRTRMRPTTRIAVFGFAAFILVPSAIVVAGTYLF